QWTRRAAPHLWCPDTESGDPPRHLARGGSHPLEPRIYGAPGIARTPWRRAVSDAARRAALRLGGGSREQCRRRAHPSSAPQAGSRADPNGAGCGLHDTQNPMISIRRRLLVGLLGALTITGLTAAAGVYLKARGEANILFDYQLKQIALSLRDHAATTLA